MSKWRRRWHARRRRAQWHEVIWTMRLPDRRPRVASVVPVHSSYVLPCAGTVVLRMLDGSLSPMHPLKFVRGVVTAATIRRLEAKAAAMEAAITKGNP